MIDLPLYVPLTCIAYLIMSTTAILSPQVHSDKRACIHLTVAAAVVTLLLDFSPVIFDSVPNVIATVNPLFVGVLALHFAFLFRKLSI